MSQKINSVSNKLGITKLWNFEFFTYGQNFKSYTKFISFRSYIFNYLNCFCLNHNLLIESINIIQKNFEIGINIFISSLKKSQEIKLNNFSLSIISKWINAPLKLYFYNSFNITNSSLLINNYINYLITQRDTTPKKVLLFIYKILKDQKKNKLIKYTIQGIRILELKGFKIEISGCFESSRSQMSKIIKCNFGIVSLTKLNSYVDYSNVVFFTKFGSCGLKVWLFYKLI